MFLLALILVIINCVEGQPKQEASDASKNGTKESLSLSCVAKNVVDSFYTWYIDLSRKDNRDSNYQNAPFKEFSHGKYGLDIELYAIRLDKIHYFSENYKKELLNRNLLCSKAMLNAEHYFNPYEEIFHLGQQNHLCNILWHDNWVGGQGENITGHEIISIKEVNSDKYSVQVGTLIQGTVFSTVNVSVEFEAGNARISNIELNF